MAEKSGFFNARLVNGEFDRKYSANDYCDNLAVVISTGVLRSTEDDLKVTSSGMLVTVAAGRAWINGHYYRNTAPMTLASVPPAAGGNRWDRVCVRMDKRVENRECSVVYLQGSASNDPQKPALTRNENVYDICLADVYVASGNNSLVVYDKRDDPDVCGWVYSTSGDNSFFESLDNRFEEWFNRVRDDVATVTILKRYTEVYTMTSASSHAPINNRNYDPDVCFVEVFVNGFITFNYTVSGTGTTGALINFTDQLTAGTQIIINIYRNIDGTGINSIVDDVAALQDAVATLDVDTRFTYELTGSNDNIALSEIAQAFIDGEYQAGSVSQAARTFLSRFNSSFWSSLNEDAQITIHVEGQNLTATTPFGGSGTAASRYRWFSFGQTGKTDRKITFDFTDCQNISIVPAANTSNIVFYGTDIHVKNARVSLFTANNDVNVDMIASSYAYGNITFEDCEFSVKTTGNVTLAQNGTFTNCRATLRSDAGNCYCFCPKSDGLIRVIGGTFFTYIKASGKLASVFYTATTETNAIVMAYNISCPTTAISGYSQAYLSTAYAGKTYLNGVISTQTSQGSYNEIVGQIWKTKH